LKMLTVTREDSNMNSSMSLSKGILDRTTCRSLTLFNTIWAKLKVITPMWILPTSKVITHHALCHRNILLSSTIKTRSKPGIKVRKWIFTKAQTGKGRLDRPFSFVNK
jgi:hypothetical protein